VAVQDELVPGTIAWSRLNKKERSKRMPGKAKPVRPKERQDATEVARLAGRAELELVGMRTVFRGTSADAVPEAEYRRLIGATVTRGSRV
jgi:hypothetical protein